ncbi:MAG: Amidohydro 3 protein [Dehalococcoidia bacterium]|nr:Amidohydro 3 protein [Dehalococcoidia bacterium]
MSPITPDLLLYNATVLTLDPARPRVSWVAVRQGRIAGVGSGKPPGELMGRPTRGVDCQGRTLIPGFHDAHCHVLATAASLLAVDCSPAAVSSIEGIKERLRQRSLRVPPNTWLRGTGYNEFYLRERRHPNRWDLDGAVADYPVRLVHRSGHAAVLNSRALALAGIHRDTPDPIYGVIEREEATGEPTGLLLEMDDYLEGVMPPLSQDEVEQGVGLFSDQCLASGITSLQDATPGNSLERWGLFTRLKGRGLLAPSVTLMAGAGHLPRFLSEGLAFGSGGSGLRLGAAKIVLTMTTGVMYPPREELHRLVREAHRSGFQVALHAVEAEAVEEAIEAIHQGAQGRPAGALRHRIEHCSECPPHLIERMVRDGVTVVTQPAFIYHGGERYLSHVPSDTLPWLYPIGSLKAAGIPLAAGSDAPVVPLNPLIGVYAAATRRAESGDVVLPHEAIPVEDALRMYTLGGAYASFAEAERGSIEEGKGADLALLDRDPTAVALEEVKDVRVLMTILGGQVVWEA